MSAEVSRHLIFSNYSLRNLTTTVIAIAIVAPPPKMSMKVLSLSPVLEFVAPDACIIVRFMKRVVPESHVLM